MLEVRGLSVSYGPVVAVRNLSLDVSAGEIVCLVGANGAGKSTTLRGIMGLGPASGAVYLDGRPLAGLHSADRVQAGLALVPEGRRIFGAMTVLENLQLGGRRLSAAAVRQNLETVFASFPLLRERTAQLGGTLSGGEQQMLALGRAMMSSPRCVLLDEPTLGLAPIMVAQLGGILRRLRSEGIALLLAEQNLLFALGIADRGYVVETGSVVHAGTAENLGTDIRVREAYLGA